MGYKLDKLYVLGAKTETTQGSAATLAATDYIIAQDVQVKIVSEKLPRDYSKNTLDPLVGAIGKQHSEVTFKTELKNGGTAGTKYAPLNALLCACAFSCSVSASNSVTYVPVSSASSANFYGAGDSATLEVYRDGLKHVVAGALGSVKLMIEAGKLPMAEFTFKGTYTAVTDAALPAVTYATTIPSKVASCDLTVSGSNTFVASKLEIDSANEIADIDDVNASTSYKGVQIVNRNPVGSFDPLVTSVSTHDFLGKMASGATMGASFVVGSTSGNIVSASFSTVQYNDASYASRNGLLAFQIPLKFNGSSANANDWATIVLK